MEKFLLIVDDNKEIVEIVSEVLEGLFDKIISAGTVEEAQNLLDKHHFQFVILDINLEGRNGAEVIKYLIDRPENPNNKSSFVIVSGIINPDFIQRNSQRFAGILMKPFEHSELRQIILNVLSGDKKEEPAPAADQASLDDVPTVKCDLPFPIVQLEQRVEKVMEQVKKNTRLKQLFNSMKIDRASDNYILAHIGMVINISTGISIQMQCNTDKTLEKCVYAAYLHDMAIHNRPDLAKISSKDELEELKSTLSPQDYKLTLEHPLIAARTLEGMREIPPDVEMIIRQHHELPKENGFPMGISHVKIVPLSTVFIVAHDMTDYILNNPKWSVADYLNKAKIKFKGAHFQKVLSSLNEIK